MTYFLLAVLIVWALVLILSIKPPAFSQTAWIIFFLTWPAMELCLQGTLIALVAEIACLIIAPDSLIGRIIWILISFNLLVNIFLLLRVLSSTNYLKKESQGFWPKGLNGFFRSLFLSYSKINVRRVKDIDYVGDGLTKHRLDLYFVASGGLKPVLIFVHGGAWVYGNKNQQAKGLVHVFARQGFVVVAPNYRLSPKATWPDHLDDVMAALKWTINNVGQYGGDPNKIFMSGNSAGGHLATVATIKAGQEGLRQVIGCIDLYGVVDLVNHSGGVPKGQIELLKKHVFKMAEQNVRDIFESACPCSLASFIKVPIAIVHGTHDTLVSIKQADYFWNVLPKSVKEQSIFFRIPFAQHAFDMFYNFRTRAVIGALAEWALATAKTQPLNDRHCANKTAIDGSRNHSQSC